MIDGKTILVVDDKKENLDVILDILDGFDVIAATSGLKALDIINADNIDLILLDIVMPQMDGFEVCKILKSQEHTKDIPIIFTTAKTDENSISQAYQAGANDYVSKPLKRTEVIERVKTQLRLKKTIEDLEFLASRDSMTGIYNRRKFFELSSPLFTKSTKNFFIAMLDIDYFKKINDSYGHNVGDIVIKLVAQTALDMLPKNAIFARIGGEEFIVVCIENSKEQIINLFNDIREKISNLVIAHNNSNIKVTISIGITQNNDTVKTIDELIKLSDLALYEAKNSGRNKVIFR